MVLAYVGNALRSGLSTLQLLPRTPTHQKVARRHIRGSGVELRPQQSPFLLPTSVSVAYIDSLTRAQALERYPELDPATTPEPHRVEDVVALPSLADGSQSFVIASRLLDYQADPIGAIKRWTRVLRRGGVLLLDIPLANGSARRRKLTTLEHLVVDFDLHRAADEAALRSRNRLHYLEWIRSQAAEAPEVASMLSDEDVLRRAEAMQASGVEIPFHTLSLQSFGQLLRFVVSEVEPQLEVVEVTASAEAAIGVLRRADGGG